MKRYNVSVKIVSKNEFEIYADNEEEALDIVQALAFNKNYSVLEENKKYHFDAVEIEENKCEKCDFCCPECGTCVYEEH